MKFVVTLTDGTTRRLEAKHFVGVAAKAQKLGLDLKSIEVYVPKMVTRRNLMTGAEYQEAEDTPVYLSPACESYWSM